MSKEIKIAGSISFGGKRLNVYGDLDAPLFKAKDISHAIGYSSGNEWRMLEMCEEDEKLKLPLVVAGQRRSVNFVTENGLYNILAQSRMEIARSGRRVVHDELINMRKEKGRNIAEQFEEWDRAMLRRDLIKNKIYGIIFIVLGALTIPIEWDATFFLFALMVGILLFASRENCIMD